MAVYVTEEELREEIYLLQQSKRLSELLEYVKENPNEEDLATIEELIKAGIEPKRSKENFGIMILKIVNKLSTRGNFAGYTESYKQDFYSNSLEKILSYALNNIDLEMISPRSNERVKVFAYLTQIAMNAFIEVINKRKAEQKMINEQIVPFEDFYEHVKKYYSPIRDEVKLEREQPDIVLGYILDESDENNKQYYLTENTIEVGLLESSLYDILAKYRENYTKISFTYPEEYIMSLDEYMQINTLNFQYLNLHRYEKEPYKPSFPKRQKREIVDTFKGWE